MSVFRPSNEWAASMLLSADEINELQLKFVTGEQMPLAINKDMQTLEQQYEQLSLQRMQELQEKEQLADKLNATMQAMPLAVILVDSYGCITDANPEAERLLDEQATFPLIGRFWSAVIRHCFAPQPDDGHEISLRSGKRVSVGTSALKTGGQLVVISDQTETRALQDSLSQHKRLTELGRMTASLAHQIRTPLSAALLYAQNLSHPNLDVHKRDVFNQKLVGQLHALEEQLNDMLIFAKGDVQCNDVLSSEQLIDCVRQHSDARILQRATWQPGSDNPQDTGLREW